MKAKASLRFVCTLSIAPRDLRVVLEQLSQIPHKKLILENALVSPLFTEPKTVRLLKRLKEEGIVKRLYFDSGGYQAQKGQVPYHRLYHDLLCFYRENRWADFYILPDYPPTSLDTPEQVQQKVRITVEYSAQFLWELPSELRHKTIAVVQGRSLQEISYCLTMYRQLNVAHLGYGSFGTRGSQSSVNVLDERSIESIAFILRSYPGARLHVFGVGNPPTAYLLGRMGVASFDSSGWIKAAGYGNIYFPFTRAYNVSFRRIERGNGALNEETFLLLKDLTGHDCVFCHDFHEISANRDKRMLHNLLCMAETVEAINQGVEYSPTVISWMGDCQRFLENGRV